MPLQANWTVVQSGVILIDNHCLSCRIVTRIFFPLFYVGLLVNLIGAVFVGWAASVYLWTWDDDEILSNVNFPL